MSTRITLSVSSTESPGASAQVAVSEDFDRVLNLIVPINQPASALEARENLTLHSAEDGARIMIRPEAITWIEEDRDNA